MSAQRRQSDDILDLNQMSPQKRRGDDTDFTTRPPVEAMVALSILLLACEGLRISRPEAIKTSAARGVDWPVSIDWSEGSSPRRCGRRPKQGRCTRAR
jgi:hypothetical protein